MNDARETPFLIAAREGKIDIIRLYLDSFYSVNRFEVDHKMLDGWTAVQYASMNGFANIVELLAVSGNADINIADRFHRNALHWACRFNNCRLIEVLLKLGIKWDITDIDK